MGKRTKPIKVGDRFNDWIVLEIPTKGDLILCECQKCVEKTRKHVIKYNLTSGKSKSCECSRRSFDKDILKIGDLYKNFEILDIKNKAILLRCPNCKKDIWRNRFPILNNKDVRCDCNLHEKIRVGEILGDWIVEEVESCKKIKCKCTKCGSIKYVSQNFKNKKSIKNCDECEGNEIINSTFGNWKVLKINKCKVLCQCQCKKKTLRIITKFDLKKGRTKSCGCQKVDLIRKKNLQMYGVDNYFKTKKFKKRSLKRKTFSSKVELSILKWIQSSYPKASKRRGKREIDIYIPELKVGIEYNGLYWHCEESLKREKKDGINYHIDKTKYFEKKGIKIIHLFENIYKEKKAQCEKMIERKIFPTNDLHLLDCMVRKNDLDAHQVRNFIENNEIAFDPNFSDSYSIYKDSNLICIITYTEKEDIKIKNISYSQNFNIPNVFEIFDRDKEVYLEVDRCYNNSLEDFKFWELIEETTPTSFYWDSNVKYKILKKEDLSEIELLNTSRFKEIYNCGKLLLRYKGVKS